ncbi:MAG: MFS transporter, partial [Jatrophihabitans sp.]
GGTLGTAVFLSILFTSAGHNIPTEYAKAQGTDAFKQAAAAHPDQLKLITGGTGSLNDTSFLHHIESVLAHPFLVGFSDAMDLVFTVGAIVLVAAFVLSLFMKEVPLRTMSGQQARAAAEAAAAAAVTDVELPVGAAAPDESTAGEDAGRATHAQIR